MFQKIADFFSARRALADQRKVLQQVQGDAMLYRRLADTNRRLYLTLLRETRSLNRTVERKARTIRRLRNQIALDAPTTLPPLAQSPEGRALYNHAYQMGRRKGRRDQIVGDTSPVGVGDGTNALEQPDAIGLSDKPDDAAFIEPPADAVAAVERVRETVVNDVPVPMACNDEVTLGDTPPAEPVAVVRHLRSVPSGADLQPEGDGNDRPGS